MNGQDQKTRGDKRFWTSIGLAITVFFLSCAFWMFRNSASDLWRQHTLADWVSTKGVIETWNVDKSTDSEGRVYFTPYPSYLYSAEGQAFRGFSVYLPDDGVMGLNSYRSEANALRALDRYRIGQEVIVHYDIDAPHDAVLHLSKKKTVDSWFYLLLFAPLTLLLALLILAGLQLSAKANLGIVVATAILYLFFSSRYQGNADRIEGGPDLVEATRHGIAADRAAWKALRPGAPEELIQGFAGGTITQSDSPRGARMTRISFVRTPHMERAAEIILMQQDPASPALVRTVTSPYLP